MEPETLLQVRQLHTLEAVADLLTGQVMMLALVEVVAEEKVLHMVKVLTNRLKLEQMVLVVALVDLLD